MSAYTRRSTSSSEGTALLEGMKEAQRDDNAELGERVSSEQNRSANNLARRCMKKMSDSLEVGHSWLIQFNLLNLQDAIYFPSHIVAPLLIGPLPTSGEGFWNH